MLARLQAIEERVQRSAWAEVFACTYPVALRVATLALEGSAASDAEDFAMDALLALQDRLPELSDDSDIKPCVAALARNKAVDRLRKHLAIKRGAGILQSLDQMREKLNFEPAFESHEPIDDLSLAELRGILKALINNVRKEYRLILRDRFVDGLSISEISVKRNLPTGTVGVYLQRGLDSIRKSLARTPSLRSEILEMLGTLKNPKTTVGLLSATQVGRPFDSLDAQYLLSKYQRVAPRSGEDALRTASEREANEPTISDEKLRVLRRRMRNGAGPKSDMRSILFVTLLIALLIGLASWVVARR